MPKTPHDPASEDAGALPKWMASGILGIVLGAGGMFLWTHDLGPRQNMIPAAPANGWVAGRFVAPAVIPAMPPPMGNAKRRLTSLVGRLELLSRPSLELRVELDNDQAEKIAAELISIDEAKTLTFDQAQDRIAAIEALLTQRQQEVLDAIGMPRSGGAMAPVPEASPDENPFAERIHQDRLRDLIDRLTPPAIHSGEAPAD